MVNYGKIDEAHDLSEISETALTILFPALRERVGIVFEKSMERNIEKNSLAQDFRHLP